MDTLRTGRTEDTARGENEPLAAKPGEKCGITIRQAPAEGGMPAAFVVGGMSASRETRCGGRSPRSLSL